MAFKSTDMNFKGSNYFRQRLLLSVLTGKPLTISEIRSQDDEPGLRGKTINYLSYSFLDKYLS